MKYMAAGTYALSWAAIVTDAVGLAVGFLATAVAYGIGVEAGVGQ